MLINFLPLLSQIITILIEYKSKKNLLVLILMGWLIAITYYVYILVSYNHNQINKLQAENQKLSLDEFKKSNYILREQYNILEDLSLKCNNGQNEKCFTSRWWLSEHNDVKRGTMYLLVHCAFRLNAEKKLIKNCYNIVYNNGNERPLELPETLINEALVKMGGCQVITKEELERRGMHKQLDRINNLIINPDQFTYCIGKTSFTLLVQALNHNAVRKNISSRYGCESKSCRYEVKQAHDKIAKLFPELD